MATVVWYLAACAALAHLISSFECPEQRTQALIPDPEDCRKYYHCLPGNRVFPMQCPNGLVFDARQKVCIWDSTARSCAPDTKLEPIKPWQPSDSSNKASTPAPQRNKSYNRQKTAKAKNSRKQSQNQRRRNQPEANKRKPVTPRPFGEGDVRGGLSRESTEGVNLIGNILATLGFDVPSHDNPADQGIPVNPDAMLRQESDRAEKVSPVHNNDNSGDTSNDRKGLLFQDMNRQNARQQHARHRRSPEDSYAYFPDPSSCTAFYHCYNWQPMRKLCPPGCSLTTRPTSATGRTTGWRTTDYDFTTPPSTADPDYDGFGTTSDSIFSSSDPQPSGKPVWSRRQQQSSTNEKERSVTSKQESQAQNDVGEFETTAQPQGLDESNGNNGVEVIRGKFLSVKNPKDRNSGYSLRSYDDAKDTDSKPMRSPFDSPRKENPAHRRGLYGAPNTKNFDYFDVPKTDQNVPKERNIRPLGSNDWRTTDSSFSWMVTSSLPQGHDIVKPELYASNDIKKSSDKDAENKSTDAPATTTASTLRTSSTTAQPTKTTSEKQPATSKSTVSSSTSVLPNVTTTTSVPAEEKKNTSISGDSATTVTTTGTTDSGKTNTTEETSTTSEPASFQTTSQAEEDSTQHSPSNQTRSSTDKTNFTASTITTAFLHNHEIVYKSISDDSCSSIYVYHQQHH
ncbi:hypothetical protein BaRGS_00021063 [Batillaria attramentaria]|uniref:Chitin-binding type-2 domain-containing protein n=1 Tax=Batillaria attramentaria TaxID=370345 RepID=A0ABD0KKL6_9CAEN